MYSQIAVNSGSTYSEKIILGILTASFAASMQSGKHRLAIHTFTSVERLRRLASRGVATPNAGTMRTERAIRIPELTRGRDWTLVQRGRGEAISAR